MGGSLSTAGAGAAMSGPESELPGDPASPPKTNAKWKMVNYKTSGKKKQEKSFRI